MKKKDFRVVNIGYGNVVVLSRIIGVVSPYSNPIARYLKFMKEERPEFLIDATYGNKCRSIIQTDSGFVYLSAILPTTLAIKIIEEGREKDVEELGIKEGEEISVDRPKEENIPS